MSQLSPDEIAMAAMADRYKALEPVLERDAALYEYLLTEVPGATGAEGLTAMMQATIKFNPTWPHEVPNQWEMVQADRAGKLSQFTVNANRAFRVDRLQAEAHAAANTRQEQMI